MYNSNHSQTCSVLKAGKIKRKRVVILTSPQCINSILHKSEEKSVFSEETHSTGISLYISGWKWQTKKKCLAVLTFVRLYSRDEKGLRASDSSAVLIWLSLGWSRRTIPGASASDRCARRRRCGEGSSVKQCGVRSSEWWRGRRWMRRQVKKGKEKALPTSFATKTVGISEPVFWPMLWGPVN